MRDQLSIVERFDSRGGQTDYLSQAGRVVLIKSLPQAGSSLLEKYWSL